MISVLIVNNSNEIDVSYRSLYFGFVLPVLVDKKLWSDNYEDDDSEMLWLDSVLDACACELNTNDYKVDVNFEYSNEESKQLIKLESLLEFDENINPYILIRYPETIG